MKKTIAVLLTLCLTAGLFSGCGMMLGALMQDPATTQSGVQYEPITPFTPPTGSDAPTDATVPTETAEGIELPTVDPADAPRRLQNAGARDYLEDGYVDVIPFPEMKYVRPDSDGLLSDLEALTGMVEQEKSAEEILQAYYDVNDQLANFDTMDTLAYILYTLDTDESYYKEQYDELELIYSDVREKLEAFNKACAHSSVRGDLERIYFGYGYFDKYEDYEVFTNPEYLALAKQEDELLAQYRDALADPTVEYGGKTYDFDEYLANVGELDDSSYYEYIGVLQAYYTKYNKSVGSIYIELVKTRQQMAKALGYESYAEYAYEIVYERDYSAAQGIDYLRQVQNTLVPVYLDVSEESSDASFPMSGDEVSAALQAAIRNIGGQTEEAFTFMSAYRLCDLSSTPSKFDSSYTTYLYNYETPFLTVNAHGTSDDFITFSHEFGHFTDNYVTYNSEEDLETAETFSQSMEFLALCYTEGVLSDAQVEALLRGNLRSTLDVFIQQTMLAMFEQQVYALDESKLTVDAINGIYRQCCKDFGIYSPYADFYFSQSWIDITHFFEAPYYVISYVVSADTALQVYRLEAGTPGAGLDAFNRLLEREAGDGVQAVMEKAGLDNPFRAGSLDELAAFFRAELS